MILENCGLIVESGRDIKHVNMAHSNMKLSVATFKEQYRYFKKLWDGLREMHLRGATLEDATKKYTIERDFSYFIGAIPGHAGASRRESRAVAATLAQSDVPHRTF